MDALATALTARLLRARGLQSQAYEYVTKFVAKKSDEKLDRSGQAQQYLTNGRLFTSIGAHADAEQWYRKLMDINPNAYMLVVQSLVEQNKRREAAAVVLWNICQRQTGRPDGHAAGQHHDVHRGRNRGT